MIRHLYFRTLGKEISFIDKNLPSVHSGARVKGMLKLSISASMDINIM